MCIRDSRRVVPIVEEIADERMDIKVGKINVDEEPELCLLYTSRCV